MTILINTLPEEKVPYLLRNGEGLRYLFGRQVATIMANGKSTGNMFEIVLISGGKGDSFPLHLHKETHEGILVLNGKVELILNGEKHLLVSGDYAQIPAGTTHSYTMQSHRTRFVSYTMKGNVANFYAEIGTPYEHVEHPPYAEKIDYGHFLQAASISDIEFVLNEENLKTEAKLVTNSKRPDEVVPYVLESGEGDRLLTGDQLHRIVASQANTDGQFIVVSSEGPTGDRIIDHYHEHHTETFYCLEGQMTMWANGKEIKLNPGDFLHVPANTVHSYRLDSPYTKMVGVLVSGLFEPFFRTLGDQYEYHIFPTEPQPLRFDRIIENIHNLDLKIADQKNV
ncbi:quercetin 2,3-dioxygenase [Bacillus thuringiensis serovar brasilensis]|uniref:quercetin 2,3-dioxygenase n=1 Tax=Bacillus cereus group TaxID=86661 RepID=UPI000A390ACD|nr:quercetin 2,3-dioxygenase [Bacillus thuringiensis]MCU5031416.1 quercetin 2,3-dioxygenase [Bacillus cereus]MRA74153.1 cupin domain-containing protein [Bacillus thuringiensis]MRA92737.1 cupin domain-containing protein [Bacillus thuringiensis]MRC55317.1 cupin domain-containing protein [Bacillus thuringiensis]OTX35205.1 quercetin 2,3-dioxygenase [Bacillus thuringiensis serovar brasilensis]